MLRLAFTCDAEGCAAQAMVEVDDDEWRPWDSPGASGWIDGTWGLSTGWLVTARVAEKCSVFCPEHPRVGASEGMRGMGPAICAPCAEFQRGERQDVHVCGIEAHACARKRRGDFSLGACLCGCYKRPRGR